MPLSDSQAPASRADVLVIGGGVIGVCSAYYVALAGSSVTLVERGEVCAGCSYGNAGLIVPSHSIPLAAPGVLNKALKWMLDGRSPLYIRPRWNLELLSWLWQFRAACNETSMRRAMPVLRDLSRASAGLYEQLSVIPGLDFGYRRDGLLMVYKGRRAFKEGTDEAGLLKEIGIESRVLNEAEVLRMEPAVLPEVAGGVYFPADAHLIPADFVRALAREAERLGAQICPSSEVAGWETSGRRISAVRTTRGRFQPDQVVLAGGAWSPVLARSLGIRLPIQAAKGYSITLRPRGGCPRLPLMLSEAKVAVTPMGNTLRLAGTLELAGLDLSVNRRRLDAVMQAGGRYISGLEAPEVLETWQGLRPCTPDGLPIIERSERFDNLILATGHAMLGMSLGPVTGKLVSQLVSGDRPTVDMSALRLGRFH